VDRAEEITSAKQRLRAQLLAARGARPAEDLERARAAVRSHVLGRADEGCVAAYVPLRTEPGSVELLTALHERGIRVLVPVTLPDRDLAWTVWTPEPSGSLLGVDAIGAASLVLVPALAVAPDGTRLGRGGGSYDRALARRSPAASTAALVFDEELLDRLPRDDWDVPVAAAVTPSGWVPLGGNADFPSGR
jgi:5-formyltetrahydrofolate cyclo-ligase